MKVLEVKKARFSKSLQLDVKEKQKARIISLQNLFRVNKAVLARSLPVRYDEERGSYSKQFLTEVVSKECETTRILQLL